MARLPGRGGQNLRFYLYDNVAKRFTEIHDGFLCGRNEGDLRFPEDNVVSRRQCQFSIRGNDVYVEDLNSTNKTKVNGVPLRPCVKRRLRLNDVIEFGTQRLVLSHQDRFSPPNIQDQFTGMKLYKAARTESGKLTSEISQVFTKKTLLLLDKATFRKLQLEETFTRRRRRRGHVSSQAAQGVPAGKGGWSARADRSPWLVAALLLGAWAAAIVGLGAQGALDSGLPNDGTSVAAGIAADGSLATIVAVALYAVVFRRVVRGSTGRGLVAILLLAGSVGGAWSLAHRTGLLSRVFQNVAGARCIRTWEPELCRNVLELERSEWIRLPASMRETIDSRLRRR